MVRSILILIIYSMVGSIFFGCSTQDGDEAPFFTSDAVPAIQTAEEDRDFLNNDITQSRQNAITRAVSHSSPAVVGINVTQIRRVVRRSPFNDDPFWSWFYQPQEFTQKVKGLGSGFLISPDGHILTNAHVVNQATEIIVTTTDGQQYQAEKVGEDPTYDVSLLKIEGADFPFIPLGDSEDVLIGEWVIALGNPFGLFDVNSKPTVTVGVVSATNMNFKGESALEGRSYQDMIQTDAAINGGNSGGPLVNSLGQCIGINTFIFSGSGYQKTSIGIGFAISINRVKRILPDLREVGYVDRSFQTGLEVENISRVTAWMLGISQRDGVVVSRVGRNTPAEEAKVQVGDVIVAVDGLRVRSTTDVQRVISAFDVTENPKMAISIFREGKLTEMELNVQQ